MKGRRFHAQITIKGAPLPRFSSIKAAHSMALKDGCTLCITTFAGRHKKHPDMPWAELIASADVSRNHAASRATRRQQQLDEAEEICRNLDERKRLLTSAS